MMERDQQIPAALGRFRTAATVPVRGGTRIQAVPEDSGWFSPLPALGGPGVYALIVLGLSTHPYFDAIPTDTDWRFLIDGAWLIVFASGLLAAFHNAGMQWIAWSVRTLPLLWLVLLVAISSSVWSLEPLSTLGSASWMAGTSVVGIAVGYLLSPKILMRVLFWVFSGILLASLAVELSRFDGTGYWLKIGSDFQGEIHRWRGTTSHPNLLGPISASAGAFFLIALFFRRVDWRLALFMCALAALIAFMTGSATSIVMLVTGLAAAVCFVLGRRLRLGGDLAALLVVVGLIGCAALALVHWERTTSLLGKDVTATTRIQMWEDGINIVEYRPLTGHGYGVVWGRGSHTFFPEFKATSRTNHVHNGYLQVATQLGLPSMVMAIALIVHTLVRGVTGYVRWYSGFALFSTIYVIMFTVGNVTEARLFEQRQFDWLLFVTLATALVRANSGPGGGSHRAATTRGSGLTTGKGE